MVIVFTNLNGQKSVYSICTRMNPLNHKTVFEDAGRIAKSLPLVDSIKQYHPDGTFTLVEDPLVTKRASLIGMFVLRPAYFPSFSGNLLNVSGYPESIYDESLHWSYNVTGLDGGWAIANGSPVDAYRLALQYSCTDAVISGSNAVSIEGNANEHGAGYQWQAYALNKWASLANSDPHLHEKIAEQREAWQKLGYLSSRKYSALIVFTWSGLAYDGSKDFLSARVFHDTHPDGSQIEVYILTSEKGAYNIKQRAHAFNLQDRIEEMLIIVPPKDPLTPSSDSTELSSDIDISLIPKILHDKYDMKLVNHDGGVKVLRAFSKAGAMSQMNLTLARQKSLLEVVQSGLKIDETKRSECLANFDSRLWYFFEKKAQDGSVLSRGIPKNLPPVSVLVDDRDEVAVVTFDTRGGFVF